MKRVIPTHRTEPIDPVQRETMTKELADLVRLATCQKSLESANLDDFIKTLKDWDGATEGGNPEEEAMRISRRKLIRSPSFIELQSAYPNLDMQKAVLGPGNEGISSSEETSTDETESSYETLVSSSESSAADVVSTGEDEVEITPGEEVKLQSRIGRGATAIVWHGKVKGRDVAIKQIALSTFPEGVKFAQKVARREYDIVRSVNHTNIIRYYGFFYDASRQEVNLVMQLISGVSVADFVVYSNGLSEDLASYILLCTLEGLNCLHKNRIIHRDMKPENILISADGSIKIIDFGTATNSARPTSTVGTPWYCAPEVITGAEYNTSSDIWSIGCLAYELISGAPPYKELTNVACLFKMSQGEVPPLPSRISRACESFLLACFRPSAERLLASELLKHEFITVYYANSLNSRKKVCKIIKQMQDVKSQTIHREILTLTQQLVQVPLHQQQQQQQQQQQDPPPSSSSKRASHKSKQTM